MVGDMTLTEKSTIRRFAGYSRLALILLLSVAITAWSMASLVGHTTFVVSDLEHHHHYGDMSDHGHSHSEAENIWWALHGHDHDKADHDHSTFYIHHTVKTELRDFRYTKWHLAVTRAVSGEAELPERPPRKSIDHSLQLKQNQSLSGF